MARLDFVEMRDEVVVRAGNHNYSTFSSRVQRWLEASYFYCATTWHHPELDVRDEDRTLPAGDYRINLPDDVYVPMGVALLDPGATTFRRWLRPRDFHFIQSTMDETQAEPRFYARFGDELYFNTLSDAAYPLRLLYYRTPDRPNFTANAPGSSVLSEEWDEIVMTKATCIGLSRIWRPDLGMLIQADLDRLIAAVPNSFLKEDMLTDRSSKDKTDKTHMGAQG